MIERVEIFPRSKKIFSRSVPARVKSETSYSMVMVSKEKKLTSVELLLAPGRVFLATAGEE